GFVQTDLAADVFAQQSVAEARKAVPAFLTAPIPVEQAAAVLIDGVQRRAARVGAPGWVLPMLTVRGVTTTLMDAMMLNNSRLSSAIARAETDKESQLRSR